MQTRDYRRLGCWLAAGLTAACGTIAGNPKKPKDGGTPPPSAVVYELPLLDFALPDAATATDGSELNLTQGFDQNKSLLTAAAARLDLAVQRVNAVTERVNAIVAAVREEGNVDDVLKFAGRGEDGKLAARIGPVAEAGSGFAYEAVVCHAGQPFVWLQWSEDGKAVSLTRDFNLSDAEGERFDLKSQFEVHMGESVTIDVTHQGEASGDQLPNPEGNGITERTHAERLASGELRLKATADRYVELPEDGAFAGDAYITGRLTPRAGAAGNTEFDTEFVGYFKGFKLLCAKGFDEDASDLWAPTTNGPRFCLGRPKGAKRFASFDQFAETAGALESVGIVRAETLKRVALPAGLNCD